MRDFDYKGQLKGKTEDQLRVMAALIRGDKAKLAAEPLYKHKMNNDAQAALRLMTKDYRVIKGGNKVGKTDELGFEVVAMCKGKCEEFGINFPHKPPLKIWYCGRDRNVLSDEPLSSIKRYLKGEGIDHRTIMTGQTIQRMHIWDDYGNESIIWFKPYNGEIGIFESANVHAVLMDEEPPRDIFGAIKTKVAIMPGLVFIAMTPDKGMSWTYDLFDGSDPDHGTLLSEGDLEQYQGSVFDNLRNFKIAKGMKWVRYPIEYIERKAGFTYKIEDGVTYIEAPDTFEKYIRKYTFGSNEYRMRVLGQYVSFTGKVYPYDPRINLIKLHELPDLKELKIFGEFDYGYSDEACYVLKGLDKYENKYILDGFYQSYLDARDQARKIREISEYWGVKPEMIIADSQIESRLPQKDANKVHIESIVDYFRDELGDEWTVWRTEAMDKREPHIKRDWAIRDMKDGKTKFLDHENRCYYFINEVQKLEFAEGRKDRVKGKDHFDACERMFYGANVSYANWLTATDIKKKKEEVHYNFQSRRVDDQRKDEPVY